MKFTGKSNVIFSGSKLSCALRNTPKSFRELYGTVFGPEKFSGLLRNAIAHFRVLTFLETGPECGRESEASCEVRLASAKIKRDR